jgi:hypothetical protein
MKTILKTAAIAALITGFANSAQAMNYTPMTCTGNAVSLLTEFEDADCFGGYAPHKVPNKMASRVEQASVEQSGPKKIAIARLHKGRFLPLPDQEAPSWATLNNSGKAIYSPLSAATHFDILPAIAQNGVDSDNKIDEIRMAAAADGQDYVLIYAVNDGAGWGRFGDRDLDATGLVYDDASDAVRYGDAKALLVNSFNGEVVGAVTTFAPDMKTLTTLVADMASHALDS